MRYYATVEGRIIADFDSDWEAEQWLDSFRNLVRVPQGRKMLTFAKDDVTLVSEDELETCQTGKQDAEIY